MSVRESEPDLPVLPIAEDEVVEGVLKDEIIVLTGLFGGDDGNSAIADAGARALTIGKGTVARAVLRAGGEVKGSITKKKKPKYLVVGHDPGNTKIKAARAAGIRLITVAGLATVLSGATEEPEEAKLHGVRYSDGYQKPYEPTPPLYSPLSLAPAGPGGGADFLGESTSSALAVTSPLPTRARTKPPAAPSKPSAERLAPRLRMRDIVEI